MSDVLNAIFVYYGLVILGSAVTGAWRTTRDAIGRTHDAVSRRVAALFGEKSGGDADGAGGGGTASPARPGGADADGAGRTPITFGTVVWGFAQTTGWVLGVGSALGWRAGSDAWKAGREKLAEIRARRAGEPPAPDADGAVPEGEGDLELLPEGDFAPDADGEGDLELLPEGDFAPDADGITALAPDGSVPALEAGSAPQAEGADADEPWTAPDLAAPYDAGDAPGEVPAGAAGELVRGAEQEPAAQGEDAPTALPGPTAPGEAEGTARPPYLYAVPNASTEPEDSTLMTRAREITTIPALVSWTKQSAAIAEMEALDAAIAANNIEAALELSNETAARVRQELRALDIAIAHMIAMGVNRETVASYQSQREALAAYLADVVAVAEACALLAKRARNAAASGTVYQHTAVASLRSVQTHQVPHLVAAQATGHSGGHGSLYEVRDTRSGDSEALPAAPAAAPPSHELRNKPSAGGEALPAAPAAAPASAPPLPAGK